jgi:AcrR family transcriptional regulator
MKGMRGRPRTYNEEAVLTAAGELFWAKGFSATSLDDLSQAMRMTRPSIYGAFGNKEMIYRRALNQFVIRMDRLAGETLYANSDVRIALTQFCKEILAVYFQGEESLGCMVMSTAVVEAASHTDIRDDLLNTVFGIDEKIELRLDQAQQAGQLSMKASIKTRAKLVQALIHTLSIRSRAGETKGGLEQLIDESILIILG